MSKQKQILIIGAVFIAIISVLFFNIRSEYKKEYNITINEIDGMSKITYIHKLDILIKNIRGINQLSVSQAKVLKRTLFISEDSILESIKALKDKNIEKEYRSLLNIKENISKEELFKKYTSLLKLLERKRVDIADSYHLLFESNREIYFLITTAVLNIPKTIENIGVIRGVGVSILRDKNVEKDNFILKNNIYMFLENIENIKFIISKLSSSDSSQLNTLLDSVMTDFYDINAIVENLEDTTSILEPTEYFLQTSRLLNNINNIFSVSKNILIKKLEDRKERLEIKLLFGNILYTLLLTSIFFVLYINYRNNAKKDEELQKKLNQDIFISNLQDNYIKKETLKQICDSSLNHIINQFKAMNGSLYLYNEDNEKLYLGATYAIGYNTLEHTLDMHENIISENITEKKINIRDIVQDVNLGNIKTKTTKLVTIPIIEFEKSIGTMQLLFNNKFNDIDIEFLQKVVSLMATYINKALHDDELSRYFKLIDKHVLISQADLDGNIIEISEELCNLSKYTKDELIGHNHNIFKHEDMPPEIYEDMWNTITQGITWRGELKNRTKDGGFYWIDSVISADKDINGNIIGYTAIRTNITDKKKVEEIAITDGLTSLHNRRHFDNIFTQQIEINKRAKGMLAFLLIDIDHFKQYNDTYGHQEGDTALKLVATALKKTLRRPDDYTFRLGGEEFGLLYHIANEDDGISVAELARQNIENLKIEHSTNSASQYVTISSGLYIIKADDTKSDDEIYKMCDEALYVAKQSGRNQVSVVKV